MIDIRYDISIIVWIITRVELIIINQYLIIIKYLCLHILNNMFLYLILKTTTLFISYIATNLYYFIYILTILISFILDILFYLSLNCPFKTFLLLLNKCFQLFYLYYMNIDLLIKFFNNIIPLFNLK